MFRKVLVSACMAATMAFSASVKAEQNDLDGFKGQELRGAIFCAHRSLTEDLIWRLDDLENYRPAFMAYASGGYCMERDIKVFLVKPMVNHKIDTWEGTPAEAWEIDVIVQVDGAGYEKVRAYGIVFPYEMVKEDQKL